MWKLIWCIAIACGPADIKTDLSSPGYSKDACVAEANKRLTREPQMLFVCKELNPAATRRLVDQIVSGQTPDYEPDNAIYIGPKTLSY